MPKLQRVLGVLLVTLVVYVTLCHYRFDRHSLCEQCFSEETQSQWFLGSAPLGYQVLGDTGTVHGRFAVRLSGIRTLVSPSIASRRLFPQDHQHVWKFRQASPYYLLGTRWGGCVLGGGRRVSPFSFAYLRDPGFSDFVEDLVREHRYGRADLRRLFEDDGGDSRSEAFRQAVQIAREYWKGHPNPDVERVFNDLFGNDA